MPCACPPQENAVHVSGPKGTYVSEFDHVFGEATTNDCVFEQHRGEARHMLLHAGPLHAAII